MHNQMLNIAVQRTADEHLTSPPEPLIAYWALTVKWMANPKVLRTVSQAHDGMAGVFGAILVEGKVRQGDEIELVN